MEKEIDTEEIRIIKKKRSRSGRILRRIYRTILVAFILLFIIFILALMNIRVIILETARHRFPGLIINIEEARLRFPKTLVLKGIYLQNAEDVTASSAVRIPSLDADISYSFPKTLGVSRISADGFTITIDRNQQEILDPFTVIAQAIPPDETGTETSSAFLSGLKEINVKNSPVRFIAPYYDVTMKLNLKLSHSVETGRKYGVSGSVKELKIDSYGHMTKPLDVIFDGVLSDIRFSGPMYFTQTKVSVNNIPANLEGILEFVEMGPKINADVRFERTSLNQMLGLFETEVPVIGMFRSDGLLNVTIKFLYDPDTEEFVKVAGDADLLNADLRVADYKLDVKGVNAEIPFQYRGTMTTSLWTFGSDSPDTTGKITARELFYDRYQATDVRTGFAFDGIKADFNNLRVRAYGGSITGEVSVRADEDAFRTAMRLGIDRLNISDLLSEFEQKTFDIAGRASGDIRLELTDNIINSIDVRLTTEDGIFAIKDIEESLSALPGGSAATEELKRSMGREEYWNEFVRALQRYPYENGTISVAFDPDDGGSVILDVWLKGKQPEPGAKIHFPTIPITIGYHGLNSINDIFNIEEFIGSITED